MKEEKRPTHRLSVDKAGIVYIKLNEDTHLNPDTLAKIEKEVQQLAGSKKVLAMVDGSSFHTMCPESAAYIKKEILDNTRIATAVISNQVGVRLMVDHIAKVQLPKSPIRMFTTQAQGRAWLMSFTQKPSPKKGNKKP